MIIRVWEHLVRYHEKTYRMSTLSIKRRVVAVATLAAGLQGGVLAPSMVLPTLRLLCMISLELAIWMIP